MMQTTIRFGNSIDAGRWMDGFHPLVQIWRPGRFKLEFGILRNYFGFELMAFSHLDDGRTWGRVQIAAGLYYGPNLYIHFPARED